MSRLSTPLQLEHLQDAFTDLNPGFALDLIDWRSTIDEKGIMSENVDAFEEAYPQFTWARPEERSVGQYDKMAIDALADEAEPYGYELIRARKLEGLQKLPARLQKVKGALMKCQGLKPKRKPRKKITCKEAERVRVCFMRCPR